MDLLILQEITNVQYMKRLLAIISVVILSLISYDAVAQIVPVEHQKSYTDSLRKEFDKGPYFTLYKDNYFLVGSTLGKKPTSDNSDVKFQISISQRLTKSTLPWNTYIFLMYTQKVFWDVFKRSMPMHDLSFNPGLGISKPLFNKDRYVGKATLLVEHESNGRDEEQSRSWNRISLGASIIIDDWIMVHGKAWIPIVDGENNRDILRYTGLWQNGVVLSTPNKQFIWGVTLTKRKGKIFNFNTTVDFSWRMWNKANQYFYIQYYNGYGESLLDYNKFQSMIRIGLVIKPRFFSDF
jgi:phospholipase A1